MNSIMLAVEALKFYGIFCGTDLPHDAPGDTGSEGSEQAVLEPLKGCRRPSCRLFRRGIYAIAVKQC
jgi:hypothetical protein